MRIRQLILKLLPLRLRFAMRYMAQHKRCSLLIRPKRFNEKLALRLAVDRREILRICADKIRMREWIIECGFGAHLSEIFQVVSNSSEVQWCALPERFVMKGSHGSGFVKVVTGFNPDNSGLIADLINTMEEWLLTDYGIYSREWAYVAMEKHVLFERFIISPLADVDGTPWDLKFFCFSGRCEVIQVDSGRFKEHRRDLFDVEWNPIDCCYHYPRSLIPLDMPTGYNEALRLAENISEPFDFVRVDIYITEDKPVIGELTLTPGGGVEAFSDRDIDIKLGKAWKQKLA